MMRMMSLALLLLTQEELGGLSGWKAAGAWQEAGGASLDPTEAMKLVPKDGRGVLLNGRDGKTVNLLSLSEYGDVEAHIEFMVSKGSNSGVYFCGRYEIQILDSFGKKDVNYADCGGIYQRWDPGRGKGNEGYEGRAPRSNASKAPGEWQAFDVLFRAPRFDETGKKTANAKFVKVILNGTVIHEDVELNGPTRGSLGDDEKAEGPLILQGNHGPVAYRNIRIRHLDRR